MAWLGKADSNAAETPGWAAAPRNPTNADFDNIWKNQRTWGGDVDAGTYGLKNLGYFQMSPGPLPGSPIIGSVAIDQNGNIPKIYTSSGWVSLATPLVAPAWWTGTGTPSSGLGANSDMYLVVDTGNVYGPKPAARGRDRAGRSAARGFLAPAVSRCELKSWQVFQQTRWHKTPPKRLAATQSNSIRCILDNSFRTPMPARHRRRLPDDRAEHHRETSLASEPKFLQAQCSNQSPGFPASIILNH